MSNGKRDDYHDLIARHHAMQLRKRILYPGQHPPVGSAGGQQLVPDYDGAADQQLIVRNLHLVTPLTDVINHLYEAMFGRRPYLRSLFPHSMEFQERRLAEALTFLINDLTAPTWSAPCLSDLVAITASSVCCPCTTNPSRPRYARACVTRPDRGGRWNWRTPGCGWCVLVSTR